MSFVGNRRGPAGAWIISAWGKTIKTLGRIFEILQQIQSSFQPHNANAHSSPLTALIFQTKLFAASSIFGPSLPRAGGGPPRNISNIFEPLKTNFPSSARKGPRSSEQSLEKCQKERNTFPMKNLFSILPPRSWSSDPCVGPPMMSDEVRFSLRGGGPK